MTTAILTSKSVIKDTFQIGNLFYTCYVSVKFQKEIIRLMRIDPR